MNAVVKHLVAKDLRMNRPFIAIAIAVGLAGLAIASFGSTGYAVGSILYICASLGSGILIAMYCIVQERKDQAHLFAISLPLSVKQLGTAKLTGALASYFVVWVALTVLGLVQPLLTPRAPDGVLVFTLVIQGFQLALCCAFLGLVAVSRNDLKSGLGIFAINIVFCLFMMFVNQPEVRRPLMTQHIVFTPVAQWFLVCEAIAAVLAVVGAYAVLSRRNEF